LPADSSQDVPPQPPAVAENFPTMRVGGLGSKNSQTKPRRRQLLTIAIFALAENPWDHRKDSTERYAKRHVTIATRVKHPDRPRVSPQSVAPKRYRKIDRPERVKRSDPIENISFDTA